MERDQQKNMEACQLNRHALAWLLACLAFPAWAGQAELSWTAPTQNVDGSAYTNPGGYRVYRRCDTGALAQIADVPHAQLAYTDPGIPDDGRTCWYSLTAYNALNEESARTNEVSKTFAAAPVELPGSVSATFSWTVEQGSSMALAFANQTTGSVSSGSVSTASVTFPANSVTYIGIGAAQTPAFGATPTIGTPSGGSLTWTQVGSTQSYAGRRSVAVFRAINTGSETSGAITATVTANNGGTMQESAWEVFRVTGANTTTPNDAPVQDQGSDNLTLSDVGTVDAGDAVVVVGAHEDGANSFACTGYTTLGSIGSLANVRQLVAWYDDSSPDETPNLTSAGGGNGIGGIAFVVNVGAGGGVTLTVQDTGHGHAVDNVALTQANTLAVGDALHGHSTDNVALTQANTLAVAETLHGHSADGVNLVQAHVLAVVEALHGHAADNVDLVQAGVLVVADALHGHAADNVVLDQSSSLAPADATHGHTVDSPSLTQASQLVVADALHGHVVESPTLTQAHVLAVAETLHAHAADAVVLGTGLVLSVAEVLHAHTVDQVSLVQANILAVQEALHGHQADNVELSQAVVLVVADATHAHAAETPTLTQAHLLAIQDALHAHLADSPSLAQANTLVVSDTLHALLSDNLVFPGTVFQGRRVVVINAFDRVMAVRKFDRIATIH